MKNPQIKNKSKEHKKAITMTKALYLSKLPWAILLAAIPMRRISTPSIFFLHSLDLFAYSYDAIL